ncbi:hypothetical protein BGZ76_005870, partial [Entomortierella beljakovae]
MQFKKCLKQDQAYLCIIKPNETDTELEVSTDNEQMQNLLHQYRDVFPDELPLELPPSQSVDHRIEIIPGSEPPSCPTYQLSLAKI